MCRPATDPPAPGWGYGYGQGWINTTHTLLYPGGTGMRVQQPVTIPRSIWQLYYVAAGHKTHNPGCKTHSAGHMTQNKSYALFVQCHYRSTPGCMASVSSKWHHNITSGRDMTNRLFYPSHRRYHVTMFPPHNLSDKTKNQCSKSATISIHVPLHHSNSEFQKPHKFYKCSALPLFLGIYYLLNGTFNQAYDNVNHLINRLLVMLQRYMTRHNEFEHCWFTLLLSGLLRSDSQHISLWFLIVLYLRIHIAAQKLYWFQKIIYTANLIIVYTLNLTINNITVWSSWLHFICFWICIQFVNLGYPLILSTSNLNIKSTTGFVGGGSSARTDYKLLKPYVLSTEVQLKNPDEFSYVYGRHCTFDNAMQEIRTSGEPKAVESHVGTISCN